MMNDWVGSLWEKRFSAFIKERSPYLQRIAGGFGIVGVLLWVAWKELLPGWVTHLPESFPTSVFISVLLATYFATRRIRAFLREPDLLFLTAAEKRLSRFFARACIYNGVLQGLGAIMIVILFLHLYQQRVNGNIGAFLLFLLLVGGASCWNLLCQWRETYLQERYLNFLQGVRFSVHLIWLYGFLRAESGWIAVSVVLAFFYMIITSKKMTNVLHWERLWRHQKRLDERFWRRIAWFTDPPYHHDRIVYRQMQLKLIRRLPLYAKISPSGFLFVHFLLRHELWGMLLRLTIVGALAVWLFRDTSWLWGILALLPIIVGLQWRSFWRIYEEPAQAGSHPLSLSVHLHAFLRWTTSITYIIALIALWGGFTFNWSIELIWYTLWTGLWSFGFSYLRLKSYVQKTQW
jgi:ABC-2 type transport system permease protein